MDWNKPMAELRSSVILSDIFTLATSHTAHAWQPLREGVEICQLYREDDGPTAALLRYAPGARVPAHLHTGAEFIFVLSGSQADDHGLYPAGTLLASPTGSTHAIISEAGCIVLAIWHKPVRFTSIRLREQQRRQRRRHAPPKK